MNFWYNMLLIHTKTAKILLKKMKIFRSNSLLLNWTIFRLRITLRFILEGNIYSIKLLWLNYPLHFKRVEMKKKLKAFSFVYNRFASSCHYIAHTYTHISHQTNKTPNGANTCHAVKLWIMFIIKLLFYILMNLR